MPVARQRAQAMTLCAMFAALSGVGAFIQIPMPLVPFTLQSLFCMLAGLLLGAKLGALSQLLYVLMGLIGLPIFTKGGGPGYILQPTFGYLLGCISGAYVCGGMLEVLCKTRLPQRASIALAVLCGELALYALGVPYLFMIQHFFMQTSMSFQNALAVGLIPFIPSIVIAVGILALIHPSLAHAISKITHRGSSRVQ